jgi:signal transduction histidine kinase
MPVPEPPDQATLLDRLSEVVEAFNAGEGGLPGLHRIVELAASLTGAAGAVFCEYTVAGRVVAATSALHWSLGRPADPADPRLAKLLAGPPAQQTGLELMPEGSEEHLRGRGLHRMIAGLATVDGVVAGSLHVFFPDRYGTAAPWQIGVTRLLAGSAARLYRHGAGLPVYPQDAPPASGTAGPEQARDLFIAVTSHELRTPVTVIKGYADTLASRWDSLGEQARRDAVLVIWHRARELARLVDRLLNAASDATGLGGGTAGMPFDPAPALRDAADELADDLMRHLRVDVPDRLPKVRGDRAGVATIITELVTNACKYSTDWVDVELTAGADERTVWIRVSDRGLGISREYTERAFERFWQLETGDQRRYGGVGLGLYLVRRIVERQNGWVSLRARDGGGTVAEVRLPRADTGPGEA